MIVEPAHVGLGSLPQHRDVHVSGGFHLVSNDALGRGWVTWETESFIYFIANKVGDTFDVDVAMQRKRIDAEMHRLSFHRRPDRESRSLHIVRRTISSSGHSSLGRCGAASTPGPGGAGRTAGASQPLISSTD